MYDAKGAAEKRAGGTVEDGADAGCLQNLVLRIDRKWPHLCVAFTKKTRLFPAFLLRDLRFFLPTLDAKLMRSDPRPYLFTKSAAADLADIARYTQQQWGDVQCRSYLTQLEAMTLALAKGEGHFKQMSFIHPMLRMTKSGKHFIFCLQRSDAPPLILALLHERMNVMERLKSRFSKDFAFDE